jgi:hypothetical protein
MDMFRADWRRCPYFAFRSGEMVVHKESKEEKPNS